MARHKLKKRYGRAGPAVRGQAQLAIMDVMTGRTGTVALTDLARRPGFHGIHFKKIESAASALAKEGIITMASDPREGWVIRWVRR